MTYRSSAAAISRGLPRWERLAGTWNHWLFYALIVVIPPTGLGLVGSRGDATTGLLGRAVAEAQHRVFAAAPS